MTTEFYRQLAGDYDRVIRWRKRLEVERPLFEALWRRFGTRSVLDAACGTGHHLFLFAGMGLEVFGSDASPEMIELARQNAREAGLEPADRLACCEWSRLPQVVGRTFDAVLCIGNSLPHVFEKAALEASLRGLWACVAGQGILLIQYKNFDKLYRTRERFLPLQSSPPPREMIALRMYDYHHDRIEFHVALLNRHGDEWALRHFQVPLKPYRPSEVAGPLRALAGDEHVSIHGSLRLDAFDPGQSDDVVIVARRVPGVEA